MTPVAPPPYDASSIPVYSPHPTDGERRLSFMPRGGVELLNANRDGVYIQQSDFVTVVLNDQEKDAKKPSFSRHSRVDGSLLLEDTDLITGVTVKLIGKIEFFTLSQGFTSRELIAERHTLYSTSSHDPQPSRCPASLSFIFPFPNKYDAGERSYPTPPSYDVNLSVAEPSGQYITIQYTLTVVVNKIRHRKTPFLVKTKRIPIDIEYVPRTRPQRPLSGLHSPFLSAFKGLPEEWRQFVYPVDSRHSALVFQLYLPSVGVFGLRDTIPLFLQVTGLPQYLRQLERQTRISGSSSSSDEAPPIRISLFRQIVFSINGAKVARHIPLGDATLSSVAPPLYGEDSLNWQGKLHCDDDVHVGGFKMDILDVNDYITLEITLPECKIRHGHRILLVTDTWSETPSSVTEIS